MTNWRARVNLEPVHAAVPANASLAEAVRAVGHSEVKIACGEGTCGACSVLVDGAHVHSCIYPAHRAFDRSIQTAAAFADGPVAHALAEHGGIQCGFCTPGMVVAIHAVPDHVAATPEALRQALDGNLCRCTGYGQLLTGAAAGLQALRAGRDVPSSLGADEGCR